MDGHHRFELSVPDLVLQCKGISLGGKLIKSFVFSTDVAVIRNCDADAVLCVYPFACDEAINKVVIQCANRPVLNGVAGAITSGETSLMLACAAQNDGSAGVVVNMMTSAQHIAALRDVLDIPIVLTVACLDDATRERISAGASILHVAAGRKTPLVVSRIREEYPDAPLMATGGGDLSSTARTIEAGARAIVWAPPNIQEIERQVMLGHRIRARA